MTEKQKEGYENLLQPLEAYAEYRLTRISFTLN